MHYMRTLISRFCLRKCHCHGDVQLLLGHLSHACIEWNPKDATCSMYLDEDRWCLCQHWQHSLAIPPHAPYTHMQSDAIMQHK